MGRVSEGCLSVFLAFASLQFSIANCVDELKRDAKKPGQTHLGADLQASIERGKQDFARQLDFFNHPEKYLNNPELSAVEREAFSKAAYNFLIRNGLNTPNANHIADHLAVNSDPRVVEGLKKAGISVEDAHLLVLIHDLGKEYEQLPVDYRNFIENVFPVDSVSGKDVNFSNRVVMGHEFASMIMIDKIAAEEGISQEKAAKLKALISHHNAGYDPNLSGFNFWVKFWPDYAKKMNAAHTGDDSWQNIPESYAALQSVHSGQDPRSINLTANDRATSYTLASQEKFAVFLPSMNQWSNAGLADQFVNNANQVSAQVKSIYSQFPAAKAGGRYRALMSATQDFFLPHQERLRALADDLPKMAKAEGRFSDRPPLSVEEAKGSIVYKNTQNLWFKIDADGKVYTGNGNRWSLASEFLDNDQVSPATILFRKIISPDFSYSPETLNPQP